MRTALFTHPACAGHDPGVGHPDRPERLVAIRRVLEAEDFVYLDRCEAPAATASQLNGAHPRGYVERLLRAIPRQGIAALGRDTSVSPGSVQAALHAAGAVCAAVDDVLGSRPGNAFCAVRPPGHHAEACRSRGFCLFNNVAIGAMHARSAHGIRRIAVVDFDVHHGNGTQSIFWDDPDLFYASTHQSPLYPDTGQPEEQGAADNILNAPLAPTAGSPEFRLTMQETVLPAVDRFQPELLMISAGFDGHALDPLACLNLCEGDYAWVTGKLCDLAARHTKGRIVSVLEGGYNPEMLAACTAAHVRELMAAPVG